MRAYLEGSYIRWPEGSEQRGTILTTREAAIANAVAEQARRGWRPMQPSELPCDYCDNGLNLGPGVCGACGRVEPHRCSDCDAHLDEADIRNDECHWCGWALSND